MMYKMGRKLHRAALGAVVGAFAALTMGSPANAEFDLAGKRVIFVPISMGISLTEGWARRMGEHADIHGYSFEIRDAAFNGLRHLLQPGIRHGEDFSNRHGVQV